jgi:glutaredoxin
MRKWLGVGEDRNAIAQAGEEGAHAAPEAIRKMTETRGLALYQTRFCPYCVRVRRALEQLGLEIEIRDLVAEPRFQEEILDATGRQTVPVLRIEDESGAVKWMSESLDIIRYLEGRFAR